MKLAYPPNSNKELWGLMGQCMHKKVQILVYFSELKLSKLELNALTGDNANGNIEGPNIWCICTADYSYSTKQSS